jgi:hypothetical protein
MALTVFTNFDTAATLPDAVTAALGGTGRYKGRFYVLARDKADALDRLRDHQVLAYPHARALQPVPRAQQTRVEGLREAGVLTRRGDLVLVVTHDVRRARISQPPVLILDGATWTWEGRIRNGGKWQPLTEEDTAHLHATNAQE